MGSSFRGISISNIPCNLTLKVAPPNSEEIFTVWAVIQNGYLDVWTKFTLTPELKISVHMLFDFFGMSYLHFDLSNTFLFKDPEACFFILFL